jgi:ribonuclease D
LFSFSLAATREKVFQRFEAIIIVMLISDLKDPVWIDTPQDLDKLTSTLANESIFAVDTESNSLFAYREQVCLIQISTETDDYLIDPLALKHVDPLGALFSDPRIEKVFHAGEYDLICLKRDYGFEFNNLFDTMVAGRILGREVFGLSGMLEAEFGIALDKKWQRANWGIRPMPPAQLAYARMDSHFLIPLRNRIKQDLIDSGRLELAEEDFHRLERTPIPQVNGEKEIYWKLANRQDLTSQQMIILQHLCEYRENLARKADLPAFKILTNEALIEIAQAAPANNEELEKVSGLSLRLRQRYAEGLLECVARGQHGKPPRRPSHPRKDDKLIQRMDALKSWRKKTAADFHVESDVILPREVVEQVAAINPRSRDELSSLMTNFPLRLERFGDEILEVLKPKEIE